MPQAAPPTAAFFPSKLIARPFTPSTGVGFFTESTSFIDQYPSGSFPGTSVSVTVKFRACCGEVTPAEDGIKLDEVAASLLGISPGDVVTHVPR